MWNVKQNDKCSNKGNCYHYKIIEKILSNMSEKYEIKVLHNTDILGTAHILGKVLRQKYEGFNMGIYIQCGMNLNTESRNTICPRTVFCYRCIIANTLHIIIIIILKF